MSFDPLHKWLGIPASEQPPNHYRLLGIPLFEDDLEVIDAAADKQLAFLHDLTNGPHAEAAEDLSNRVSAARVCLCSPKKKATYDAKLRRKSSPVLAAASADGGQHKASVVPNPQEPRSPSQTPRNQKQTSGWMLIHGDGIEHGPYPFASLVDAAGRGRITRSTMVRHAEITGGQWQQALSVKGIADACPASVAVAPTFAETPSDAPADTVVATALRPEPARVSVKTQRKSKRSNRSWMATVVGSALPPIMLIALVVTIQSNPRLRAALANVLLPQDDPVETVTEQTIVVEPPKASDTPGRHRLPDSHSKAKTAETAERPQSSSPNVNTTQSLLSKPDLGGIVEPPAEPIANDTMHRVRIDLTGPSWSELLEDARVDDQFFVVRVDNVNVRLDMEPLSGALSFDGTTSIEFTRLNGPSGLGMKLSLQSNGDPAEIRLQGRAVVDGEEYLIRTLKKRLNDVSRQLVVLKTNVNDMTAARKRALAIVNGPGPIELDRLNQAKNIVVQSNLALPDLIRQHDAVQAQWMHMNSMIEWMEELTEKGELVICVRRFSDPSDSAAGAEPSLGP